MEEKIVEIAVGIDRALEPKLKIKERLQSLVEADDPPLLLELLVLVKRVQEEAVQ